MTDLPEAPEKYICRECGHVSDALLVAVNPFDPEQEITGCVRCFEVNAHSCACQVEGCDRLSTAGVPGAYGYRYAWLCSDHYGEWTRREA